MPKNRNRPRKRRSPTTRHGRPPAPERPSSERGKPFPRGNEVGSEKRFPKGKSGNPGGVPRSVVEFREMCQKRTALALARIDDVLDHGSEEGIIKAAKEIWANGWGKPPQTLEVGGRGGKPLEREFPAIVDAFKKIAGEG